MKVKIAYDFDENEYIAFVDKIPAISGYGETERLAVLDLLHQALKEDGWEHDVIRNLIDKIENETDL